MKHYIKTFFGSIFLLVASSVTSAQQEIKVGDKLPDIKLYNVAYYPSENIEPLHLKKKLIILDFWGTRCSACIESFPKTDSLQKKYRDKIQIIMINTERYQATIDFFKSHKRIQVPNVPFVTSDTIINKLFPHQGNPFVVMMDSLGRVLHITYGHHLNDETLGKLLADQKLNIQAQTFVRDFDRSKPVLLEGNGRWLPHVSYYAYLMKCVPELSQSINGAGFYPDSLNNQVDILIDGSAYSLYAWALYRKNKNVLGNTGPYHKNLRVFEVKDSIPLINGYELKSATESDEWVRNYTYYYNQRVPFNRRSEVYDIMLDNLKNYFPYSVSIEKRKVRCIVLTLLDSIKLKSKGGTQVTSNKLDKGQGILTCHYVNANASDLKYLIGNLFADSRIDEVFVSKAEILFNFDLQLKLDLEKINRLDLNEINDQLVSQGLKLSIEPDEVNVMVFRDKKRS